MRQTLAIFLDAYRELNARRLFWLVLVLSGLVVVVFLILNITDEGNLKVLVWETPVPVGTFISKETFFKLAFTNFGVQIWLAWIATVLALVSTAPMIPDFISGGSIDLVLAKPISRWRLFLTKYASGLLFVALQVAVFSVLCFFVIGFKAGAWEPAIFLAVPIVVIFFSYLFSVCVLIGLVTGSTIASLLWTLVLWFIIFGLNVTESVLFQNEIAANLRIETTEREIAVREDYLKGLRTENNVDDARIARLEEILQLRRQRLPETVEDAAVMTRWHTAFFRIKTVLPKTSETIELLERWLVALADMPDMSGQTGNSSTVDMAAMGDPANTVRIDQAEVQKRLMLGLRRRSVLWVIGTSLLFEFVILAFATWRFSRRDF